MLKPYKKPDLNAPRYRPKRLNLLNAEFCKRLREEHPKLGKISDKEIKQVLTTFHGLIWNTVIETRDGVELPEQVGYIFIGSCPRKKGENTNYKKSGDYGVKVQNQNWESDQYTAKIFYTNFETKYKFKHHDMWGFTGVRDFKRSAGGENYKENWKKYVQVDNLIKVSLLFRKQQYKQFKKQETTKLLNEYDEFNLD